MAEVCRRRARSAERLLPQAISRQDRRHRSCGAVTIDPMLALPNQLSPPARLAILCLGAVLGGALGGLAVFAIDQLRLWIFGGYFVAAGSYLPLYWRPGAALGLVSFLITSVVDRFKPLTPRREISQSALGGALIACAGLWVFAFIRHHLEVFGPVADGYSDEPAWRPALLCLVFALPATALATGLRKLSRLSWPTALWLAFLPFAISVTFRAHGRRDAETAWWALVISALVLAAIARFGREKPRRLFATVVGALTLAAIAGVWSQRPADTLAAAPASKPPNILLLVVDTLRFDIFQQVVSETPEGRRFAEAISGSAWFEHALSTGPWTAPSMGSMLTGLYPEEHGFISASDQSSHAVRPLADAAPTLAEKLQEQGYWTEAVISNPLLKETSGISRGFHRYRIYAGPTGRLTMLGTLERLGWIAADYYQNADVVAGAFEKRLPKALSQERPFFFWVHFMDPHAPLKRHSLPWLKPEKRKLPSPTVLLYRDEVRFVLREIAGLLEQLEDQGLLEKTAVFFVSDHGEMLSMDQRSSPPLTRTKGHGHALHQELMHVPLVIRPAGGLPQNRRIEAQASLVDLHDTVLDLAELDSPRIGFDRRSLAPWLKPTAPEKAAVARTWTYGGSVQIGAPQHAFVVGSSKIILHDGPRRPELYDLESDRRERRNLAQEQPEQLNELRQKLSVIRSQLRPVEESGPLVFDDETRRQLEALGYLGGSGDN